VPAQAFFFARNQRMSKQDSRKSTRATRAGPRCASASASCSAAGAAQRAQDRADADVVIVNPEHYAVALKYDLTAPSAVRGGQGRRRDGAVHPPAGAEHQIEVLELPPLARAIYNTSQVNQQIPCSCTRPCRRC
jgi:flagellar biosynthetic protein FlhB